MPICTLTLTYEIYEGSLGTYGPLPLLSWTVYVNGLNEVMRRGMQKFFPELQDSVGTSLSFSQTDKTRSCLNLATTMSIITTYLNWLDSEGFKIVGNTFDSSVYSGGVTKTILYTMQIGTFIVNYMDIPACVILVQPPNDILFFTRADFAKKI